MRSRTTNVTGKILTTQVRNETRSPVACSMRPMPIRFGGVPTGREQAADRGGIGDDQHQPRGIGRRRPAGVARHHPQQHRLGDGQHHRGDCRVAHPGRQCRGGQSEQNEGAGRVAAHDRQRQGAERDALAEPVLEGDPGEQEAADEQQDDRVAERREDLVDRRDAEEDAQRQPDQSRHRQRQHLGDPQGHDHHHDRGQTPSGFGDAGERKKIREQRQPARERQDQQAPADVLQRCAALLVH
jgi:hypothetical protein